MLGINSNVLFQALRRIKKEDIDVLKLTTVPKKHIYAKPRKIDATFTPKMMSSFYFSNETLNSNEVLVSLINSYKFGFSGYHLAVPIKSERAKKFYDKKGKVPVWGYLYDVTATSSIGKFLYKSDIDEPELARTIERSFEDYASVFEDVVKIRKRFEPREKQGYRPYNAKTLLQVIESNSQAVFSGINAGLNFLDLMQHGHE